MTEDLLHFIWKFKLLRPIPLCTTGNSPLEILHQGEHNRHAGPDFTNGRIRLGPTEWAGNIEIHRRSSEWNLHNHQGDKAYDNVILHVVHQHDKEVFNSKDQPIPCLELQHYIEPGLLEKYGSLYKNRQEIPCGKLFSQCNKLHREAWLERVLIERLEEKTVFINEVFGSTRHNWEETFFLLLCRNFGFKVNSEPFLLLGRITPLNLLLRHAGNLLQLEALLLGQAGLLEEEFTDAYARHLQQEYAFLRHKYGLTPMLGQSWKFMRMRPINFPTVRIAQMAAFIQQYQHTFSRIVEADTVDEVKEMFRVSASASWTTRYSFKGLSRPLEKKLGEGSIENILINTVCPLLFCYGKEKQDEGLCQKAIDWYSSLAAEDNHVTRIYEEIDFEAQHAAHSQALVQLYKNYCSAKKCLQCGIGTRILTTK